MEMYHGMHHWQRSEEPCIFEDPRSRHRVPDIMFQTSCLSMQTLLVLSTWVMFDEKGPFEATSNSELWLLRPPSSRSIGLVSSDSRHNRFRRGDDLCVGGTS